MNTDKIEARLRLRTRSQSLWEAFVLYAPVFVKESDQKVIPSSYQEVKVHARMSGNTKESLQLNASKDFVPGKQCVSHGSKMTICLTKWISLAMTSACMDVRLSLSLYAR